MSNYNPQLRYRILTAILAVVFAVSGWIHLQPVLAQSLTRPTTVFTDSVGKISLTASLFGSDNRMVTNGEYQVRFGIYNKNRDVINPYPSNADQGSRLWEETQTVTVKNGLFRAFLGAKTPFPTTLNFENGDYYLGIRIGTDSEMVPRKRLGAVPSAINSQFLNGYPVGTKAKMIPLLGKGGSLTLKGGLTAAGNLDINGKKNDIAGTLNLSGNALTSGGLLTVTPASGFTLSSLGGPVILDATGQPITITGAATIWNTSTLDINNTGAITIGINGNAQDITFETQNFDVNSTGAVTIDGTNFTYTPSGTYTVIPGSTYTIDATGAVSIDSDASSTLSGAGVNLTSDGANAITLTYAATGGTFQLTDGTTRIEVADNGDVVVGDDGATTTLDGSLITLSGNTLIVGQITETVTDNITDALDIQQGTNNYINVNTTDGAEAISFGNTTTNPSFIFLGTGVTSFAGDLDMQNNLILNIGNAGTDFTASGGLNLAGNLDVNGTANDIAGTLNLSGNALTSSGLLTITPTSGLTVNSAGQPITINGSTFDLNNSGAITIGTDLSEQNITFETLNFDVNSTGTVTIDGTNFTYTPSGTYQVTPGSTYSVNATGTVTIDSVASSTLSGAGVSLTSDGANAITITYAGTGGTFQLTDGTTRMEVADSGNLILGDDGATTFIDGSLITLSGDTLIVGAITQTVTDNITDALDIQEGTNNYINVNTTDLAEAMQFGNVALNPSYTFLGTGLLTVGGSIDVNGTTNDIAGTLNLSGNALTSSGLLTITPTSGLTVNSAGQPITINGSTFDLNNSGAITIGTDLSEQNITFETLNFDVNSTGTVTIDGTNFTYTPSGTYQVTPGSTYSVNATGTVTIDSVASSTLSGAGVSLTSDGANAITITYAGTGGTFQLTDGTTRMEVADSGNLILGDDGATTFIDGSLITLSGDTLIVGAITQTVTDNITDALDIQEGTNNYINVNTTDLAEAMQFGNVALNPSYTFLGTGILTVGGSIDVNGTTNDIAGTLNLSGNALTSSGLLTITPTSGLTVNSAGQPITINGSTFDLNNSGAITIGTDLSEQNITFETLNFDVNSTGTVTIDGTNFTYTPSGTYQVTPGSTYSVNATGTVTIDSVASSTLSGAGVNVTSDGANAITLTYAATGGTFQLTDGTTRMEVADNGDLILGDDGATTFIDGSLITLSGNTLIVGAITQTVTDNITNALDIQEGTNNYININTSDGAEAIQFGNATTNPSFGFLGTGLTTFAGNIDMQTNLILNIGNAGTDFTNTGGLNLAGNLDVNGTVNDIAGTLNLSGNALTASGLLTITPTSGLTVNSAGQPITINGSIFDLNNSGAITIGTDLSEQNITFETLNFDINSTGAVTIDGTNFTYTPTGMYTVTVGSTYTIDATGAVSIDSVASSTLSGAGVNVTSDGANAITLTYAATGGTFQLTDGTTRMEVADNGDLILGDDGATTFIDGSLITLSGNTLIVGAITQTVTDNITNALDIQEGTNNYININTTDLSEAMQFGNVALNPTYTFLGTGLLTVGGNIDFNGTGTNDIAGTLNLSGGALTSTGAMTVTPAAGANLNVNLSTTGDFAVNTNQLYVDTSAGFVGIGTTVPGSALDVKGTLRLSGSTSGYVGLAPAANAGSITYTLPSTDGGSGQVLATNGGAILSWSPVNWTVSGNDLYNNNSGNVGIGTTSPASLFSVGATSQFQVNSTGAIVASAGITSTGNATISTAINSTNTFGSGASSINTIGSATTPGALTLLGSTIVAGGANTTAITLGNVTTNPTLTLLGTGLTTLGGNLTVTGTAWTATPTISGLITATSGLTATTGNITATLGNVAITAGLLSLNGVTRIDNAGVGTFITGTVIGTQTFTTNNIADSGALTIASGTASALTLNSGTTGTINIGTDASAETINIGNTGAAAKTIYIGNNATAGTVTTIGSATNTGLVLSDAQWSVTDAGVANFVSVGTGTAGTGAFTTLSATGFSITSANTTQVTTASALALNVNSLTTGTGFYTASSSLSSGSLFDLAITGTAGLTNQKGLNVSLSGANATPAQTTYGAYLSNTHTGTSNNVGLYATATGGTNNYAAIFESGNVGIGTTAPAAMLSLFGTANALRLSYDATNYSTLSADSTGQLQIKGASVYDASLTLGSNAANNVAIIFDDNSTAGDFYAGVDNDASGKFKIGLLSHDAFLTINTTGNVGIGDTSPSSLFTVGNGDLFQVDASGNIVKINNITYSWPGSQGAASSVLANNGSGTLTWGTLGAASITADSLDFTEFKDALTLDASTDIALGALTLSTSGTGPVSFNSTGTFTVAGNIDFNGTANDIAGTLNLSGGALTSTGAMTVTPAAGNNFNLVLSTTGDFAVNGSQLYVDTSTGRVGIGTTAPAAMLSLFGTANALRLSYDATNYSTLSADSTGQLQIKGASVYDASLTLGSNAANNVAIIFDDNSTAGDFYAGVDNDASGKFKIGLLSHDAFLTINTTGNIGIGTSSPQSKLAVSGGLAVGSGYAGVSAAPTDGLIIEGNVGIGTTAPGAKLQVVADGTSAGTLETVAWLGKNSASKGSAVIRVNDTQVDYGINATAGAGNFDLTLSSLDGGNPLEGLRVKAITGNVGIGTTNPVTPLQVNGTIVNLSTTYDRSMGMRLDNGTAHLETGGVLDWEATGMTFTVQKTAGGNANIDALSILPSGNVGIGTTNPLSKFSVKQGSDIVTQGIVVYNAGVTQSGHFWVDSSSNIRISGGAADASPIILNGGGAGNVGIGTTGPGALLQVGSLTETVPATYTGSLKVTGATQTSLAGVGGIELPVAGDGYAVKIQAVSATGAALAFGRRGGSATWTESMRIDSQGNVGIGTTNPGYILDVQHASSKINSKNGYLTNGADYAEYFSTNNTDLKSGEVVCVDTTQANSVKRCERSGDNNVMGVVSTNPSLVGNGNGTQRDNDPRYKIIGMIGQVPGLVSNENGDIQIGDSLTSSATPGLMRRANAGESTVGVAMQDFRGSTGTIQILISRRNQSLTVEKVEEAVIQNIASMNIQDQVDRLVANAKTALDIQIANQADALNDLARRTNFIANAATSTVMTVNVMGNVGIGVTNPSSALDVNGAVSAYGFTIPITNNIAGTMPADTLSADGKSVDLLKLVAYSLSGVQELSAKVDINTAQIASVDLKTDQNITTVAGLQASVDSQLLIASNKIDILTATDVAQDASILALVNAQATQGTDMATLETSLAAQASLIETLQAQVATLMDFYGVFLLGNVITKDALGNIDLLGGTLQATKITTIDGFAIDISHSTAPTLGTAILYPIAVDADTDGKDDFTGLPMTDPAVMVRDGKNIVIQTSAVSSGSRIFVTPKTDLDGSLAVTEKTSGTDFTVSLKTATLEPISFDWLIVEEK